VSFDGPANARSQLGNRELVEIFRRRVGAESFPPNARLLVMVAARQSELPGEQRSSGGQLAELVQARAGASEFAKFLTDPGGLLHCDSLRQTGKAGAPVTALVSSSEPPVNDALTGHLRKVNGIDQDALATKDNLSKAFAESCARLRASHVIGDPSPVLVVYIAAHGVMSDQTWYVVTDGAIRKDGSIDYQACLSNSDLHALSAEAANGEPKIRVMWIVDTCFAERAQSAINSWSLLQLESAVMASSTTSTNGAGQPVSNYVQEIIKTPPDSDLTQNNAGGVTFASMQNTLHRQSTAIPKFRSEHNSSIATLVARVAFDTLLRSIQDEHSRKQEHEAFVGQIKRFSSHKWIEDAERLSERFSAFPREAGWSTSEDAERLKVYRAAATATGSAPDVDQKLDAAQQAFDRVYSVSADRDRLARAQKQLEPTTGTDVKSLPIDKLREILSVMDGVAERRILMDPELKQVDEVRLECEARLRQLMFDAVVLAGNNWLGSPSPKFEQGSMVNQRLKAFRVDNLSKLRDGQVKSLDAIIDRLDGRLAQLQRERALSDRLPAARLPARATSAEIDACERMLAAIKDLKNQTAKDGFSVGEKLDKEVKSITSQLSKAQEERKDHDDAVRQLGSVINLGPGSEQERVAALALAKIRDDCTSFQPPPLPEELYKRVKKYRVPKPPSLSARWVWRTSFVPVEWSANAPLSLQLQEGGHRPHLDGPQGENALRRPRIGVIQLSASAVPESVRVAIYVEQVSEQDGQSLPGTQLICTAAQRSANSTSASSADKVGMTWTIDQNDGQKAQTAEFDVYLDLASLVDLPVRTLGKEVLRGRRPAKVEAALAEVTGKVTLRLRVAYFPFSEDTKAPAIAATEETLPLGPGMTFDIDVLVKSAAK
jgi:hypothetical protein